MSEVTLQSRLSVGNVGDLHLGGEWLAGRWLGLAVSDERAIDLTYPHLRSCPTSGADCVV